MLKKVLIVDDHALVRTGIRLIISKEYPNSYIDEAQNEDECLAKVRQFSFDLLLLDLNMPDSDSFRIVQYINNHHPNLKTLVLTMNKEEVYALRYFQAGIKGYINKGCSNEEILNAITVVLSNKVYISTNLMQIWAEKQIHNHTENPFDSLSNREFQIAFELIGGKTMQEISESLCISVSTVSTYKGKLYEKLNIPNNNLAQLIELARENKIINA